MRTFVQDFRHGIRLAGRSPWFSTAVVAILGLGVGSATAIFSIVNSVLLRPLPLPESERIVRIYEQGEAGSPIAVSLPNFRDWAEQAAGFEAMAATAGRATTLVSGERSQRSYALGFYGDILGVLRAEVRYGRKFAMDEIEAGAPVAITSHALATSLWGEPADGVGKSLDWGGGAVTVVGVLEPAVDERIDVYIPAAAAGEDRSSRSAHNWTVLARLKPDASLEDARLEMEQISARIFAQFGDQGRDATTKGVVMRSLLDDTVENFRPALAVIVAAVGVLLLVGCLNIAGLLFARGSARQREMAVRLSLGAGRGRVLRQMIVESLPLSLLGGLAGIVVAQLSFSSLLAMTPHAIPRRWEITLDGAALGFGLLLAVGAGILFTLLPAVKTAALGSAETLKSGARTADGGGGWLRRSLVAGQIALSLALLTCSGLLVRSLMRVASIDPGFDHERALLAELELPASLYETDAELIAYWRTALARLEGLPGVEAVGLTRGAPLESFIPNGTIYLDEERTEAYAWYGVVSAGYFAALDIPLLQGRLFENSDTVDAPHVAVINRAAAEALWPGRDPIGRTVRWGGMDVYGDAPLRIVGVVGDAREQSLTNAPTPTVYSNFYQRPARARDADAVLRSAAPGDLVSAVRKELEALDASVAVRFHRLADSYTGALAKPRFGASLIGFFAVCATLLSALGLFSAMAYAVSLRTREWGVRLAVGATARDVRSQVMREALATAGAGGALGLALAVIAARALETQLFGISAMDPASFGVAAAVILVAVLAAAWLPARNASSVHPMEALRQE